MLYHLLTLKELQPRPRVVSDTNSSQHKINVVQGSSGSKTALTTIENNDKTHWYKSLNKNYEILLSFERKLEVIKLFLDLNEKRRKEALKRT